MCPEALAPCTPSGPFVLMPLLTADEATTTFGFTRDFGLKHILNDLSSEMPMMDGVAMYQTSLPLRRKQNGELVRVENNPGIGLLEAAYRQALSRFNSGKKKAQVTHILEGTPGEPPTLVNSGRHDAHYALPIVAAYKFEMIDVDDISAELNENKLVHEAVILSHNRNPQGAYRFEINSDSLGYHYDCEMNRHLF